MPSMPEPVTASTATAVAAPDTSPDAPGGEDARPANNNPVGAAAAAGDSVPVRSHLDRVIGPDRREGDYEADGWDEGGWDDGGWDDGGMEDDAHTADNGLDTGNKHYYYNDGDDGDDEYDEDGWDNEDTLALAVLGYALCIVGLVMRTLWRCIKPAPAHLPGSARRAVNRMRNRR